MQTMRAVHLYSYGGPEVLVCEEGPAPVPGAGEVLVRVHAAGVNPVDWKIRQGYLKEHLRHTLPLVPGWDVAGVVESAGFGVTRFAAGDAVFSRPDLSRNGAYADYIVIRETELALKPASVDFIRAAAVPLAGLTAWQALLVAGRLEAGQRVLIHAAAGGVGTLAVQLARWRGATVIGTASARNHAFLRDLGADELVDYTAVPFEERIRDVDVVLDTIGGDTQARSWKTLKRGGVLVSIIEPPSPELADRHAARAEYVFVQPDAAQLGELAALVDAGLVRPVVGTILPLSEARRAQELSQAGHARGKIVLSVKGA